MSADDRAPWWYSGADDPGAGEPGADAPPDAAAAPRPGIDLSGLLTGAQRLVEWAADAVLSPHAEHGDPSAHPQCVVCRVSLLLGDSRAPAPAQTATQGDEGIRWLDVHEDR